jgi:integrase
MLGFYPARFVRGKSRDHVEYCVLDPVTGKFIRKRTYLNRIKKVKDRVAYANDLVKKINGNLKAGWNPLLEEKKEKKFTLFLEALDEVVEFKKAYIRQASKRQYDGRVKVIKDWLKSIDKSGIMVFEFNEDMASDLMDYLFKVKKYKGITYNNYMNDFKTFFNAMKKKGYYSVNPFSSLSRMPQQTKVKQPFSKEQSALFVEHAKKNDYDFWIIAGYTYYCALRPKEISELKIKNINFEEKYIEVPATIAKSKKYRRAPIAEDFLKELKPYLEKYPSEYYLVSGHRALHPGKLKTFPTRIGEHFRKIADLLGFPKEIQFYSLKDTCAERMLAEGYTTQDIRDLFGHSSIAITDAYLRKRNAYKNDNLQKNFPKL